MTEVAQFTESGQKWIVALKGFAEPDAGIEDDSAPFNSSRYGHFETFSEFLLNDGHDVARRQSWQLTPLLWAAAGVH